MDGKPIKIFLIEDNEEDTKLLRRMLYKAYGSLFEINRVNSLDGLKQFNKNYDITLLDLNLTNSEGFQTYREVAKRLIDSPIIILTGLSDEELGIQAVREGAQDYLVKGEIDSKLLSRSIKYAIERKKAEKKVKKSLEEKELLIREIHHRVKNNLQTVSSLLNLQSRYLYDEKAVEAFKESIHRVNSIARIQEMLYNTENIEIIDFSIYIHDLVTHLFKSFVESKNLRNIQFKFDLEKVLLNVDTAIPCGLIINELLTNSFKYAFPNNRDGQITMKLHHKNDWFILNICDNGIGFPKDMDFRETKTLGLRLVFNLVEQLEGTIELKNSHGAKFKIKFKELKYKKRTK